ncbi:MAG: sugar transferase [Actinomycetota bacterium]|nr:sugar transferase [Actinomycetota bacterium]
MHATTIPALPAAEPRSHPRDLSRPWQRSYRGTLMAADAAVVALALILALLLRFGSVRVSVAGVRYDYLAVLIGCGWGLSLALWRAYETRYLGVGAVEYKRVFLASAALFGGLALVAFAIKSDLSRGFVVLAFTLGALLLLAERHIARRWLHSRRVRGLCCFRVLAVGDRDHVASLVTNVGRVRYAGFTIVGACLTNNDTTPVAGVPVVGRVADARSAGGDLDVDVIAVTASPAVSSDDLRRLAWELEGSGVDLVVSPALTDIAGPRISIRPVAGLPLLHVEEPELGLPRLITKTVLDRTAAAVALLLLGPFLLLVAAAIKLTSPGPALFRQRRVGEYGRVFAVYKLRTMRSDAALHLAGLMGHNISDGLLFKLPNDPRITSLGHWLRKFSIDELPQLINVLKGDMSLVGPRPLPVDPSDFRGIERRRLLVKPGITGLWQVSGRSNVSWDQAVRLDLYYVENWSLWLDLLILWKTVFAVLGSSGAY